MECVEKLIKKDMLDPINGKKMKEKDIIPLQMVRKVPKWLFMCSGLWNYQILLFVNGQVNCKIHTSHQDLLARKLTFILFLEENMF